MLKSILNKMVVITYQMGYSYNHKKGIVTKVGTDFILIDDEVIIAIDKIIKIVIKKNNK